MRNSGVALACGICSIIIGILGGILFGVIGGGLGLILGVLGIVIGTNAKKSGDVKGQSGFVTGIIGVVFSVIFVAGCTYCALQSSELGVSKYTLTGCVGGSCSAVKDGKNAIDDLFSDSKSSSDVEKAGNEIKNAIENTDWSAWDD